MSRLYTKARLVTKQILKDENKRKPYQELFEKQSAFKNFQSFVFSEVCKFIYDLEDQKRKAQKHKNTTQVEVTKEGGGMYSISQ